MAVPCQERLLEPGPCRETLELMPEGTDAIMYALFALATALFLIGFWIKIKAWRRGRKAEHNVGGHRERMRRFVANAAGQAKVLRKKYAGPMHAMIFYGFTFLFIGTLLVALDYDLTQPVWDYQFLKGWFYLGFETVLDAAGLAFLTGIGMAIWRRRPAKRPVHLVHNPQDVVILTALLFLGVSGFLIEGLRLAIRDPAWGTYSFAGILLRPVFNGWDAGPQYALYRTLWWSHSLVTFGFIAAIPYTKLRHIFTSPANIYLSTPYTNAGQHPKGELPTPFNLQEIIASGNVDNIHQGAKKLDDLSWKQLVMLDACTECGRCTEACPATAAGRPLSPMNVILDLRNEMHRQTNLGFDLSHLPQRPMPEDVNLLVEGVIREETLWSCVTCRACMEACPVNIEHVPLIVDMRRGLVSESRIDKHKSQLLQNLANSGNAYGFPNDERAKWAEGLGVPVLGENGHAAQDFDVLYWVGCAGSFDPRNQKVSQALTKVLQAANVKFAILGSQERCNGDPARRLGEDGRYQEMVMQNAEAFKAHNVKKVVTQCPHCFNTLKHEYKRFGVELDVMHHSQFVGELLKTGRLKPNKQIAEAMTYHDSCYIGRYNDVFDEPRSLVAAATTDLREMPRNKENGFCCGGGGSNVWFEVKEEKERISSIRMKEALATGAKTVAVACPFCMTMLSDASKLVGAEDTKVQDIVEILGASLGPPAS
jgi:Fe-S oxidoreductase/nitrate reductase gamma subunit